MDRIYDVAQVVARRAAAFTLATCLMVLGTLAPGAAFAQSVPPPTRPVVNILCQFSDEPDRQGATQAGVQALYDGNAGLTSYIREQSNAALTIVPSTLPWFVMSGSRATIMPHNSVQIDQVSLAAGCTAAAGANLTMTPTTILVLWFNDNAVGSFTNAGLTQTINGVQGTWATVFLGAADSTSPSLVAHELGHAFGMGHSDLAGWDPMAAASIGGPLGPGYDAYHRDAAGWIPANRKRTLTGNTVTLSQLTQPDAVNPMVAYVPLPNGQRYSIEYRRQIGFDTSIPAEGVFIYLVTPGGTLGGGVDTAVQAAGGGTGYEADIWRPNEIFVDAVNHVKIKINSVSNGTATVAMESYDEMPLPPTNLAVTAQTASSLAISWSEPTPHVDAFLVQYRPSGSTGAWQWAKLPDSTRSYTMSGLSGATAYDVTVQSCQGGIDDCTAQTTLTASTTGALPAPATVSVGQIGATTAVVQWTDTDPSIAHYTVTLGVGSGGACTVIQTVTVSAGTHAYTLGNLQPLTGYCGWVSATNGVGTVGSWPWFSFTTAAG